MINFVRSNKRNVGLIMVVAVVITWLASGWAAEHREGARVQRMYEAQIHYLSVLAINQMNGRQYEASKAGNLQARLHKANGKLGPLQRKVNDLEEDVERLRTNWTSELGVEP